MIFEGKTVKSNTFFVINKPVMTFIAKFPSVWGMSPILTHSLLVTDEVIHVKL